MIEQKSNKPLKNRHKHDLQSQQRGEFYPKKLFEVSLYCLQNSQIALLKISRKTGKLV